MISTEGAIYVIHKTVPPSSNSKVSLHMTIETGYAAMKIDAIYEYILMLEYAKNKNKSKFH